MCPQNWSVTLNAHRNVGINATNHARTNLTKDGLLVEVNETINECGPFIQFNSQIFSKKERQRVCRNVSGCGSGNVMLSFLWSKLPLLTEITYL
jgi:hypothetical protein